MILNVSDEGNQSEKRWCKQYIKIKLKVFRPIFPSDSRPDLQIARMPADIYVHRLTKCFRYLSMKQML